MKCSECEYLTTIRRCIFWKFKVKKWYVCDKYAYTIDDPDCECEYEVRKRWMEERNRRVQEQMREMGIKR